MADPRRADYLNKFVVINIIGLIIISLIIAGGIVFALVNMTSISSDIKSKLGETNTLINELNSRIEGLDKLNSEIEKINFKLSSIENSTSLLPSEFQLLEEIKDGLKELSQKYPPNQTLIINDVDQNELNAAIDKAIGLEFQSIGRKTNFNFVLNIIFGALSLTGIGVGIYFILRRDKKLK